MKKYLYSVQSFSSDATILKKKDIFCPWKHKKKTPSKVAHNGPQFFFSIANRPKTSPNLIFCSISTHIITLLTQFPCNEKLSYYGLVFRKTGYLKIFRVNFEVWTKSHEMWVGLCFFTCQFHHHGSCWFFTSVKPTSSLVLVFHHLCHTSSYILLVFPHLPMKSFQYWENY